MEDACLDTDALIEAFDLGMERFQGQHTTCISLYEFLRGLAYLGRPVAQYKAFLESTLEVLQLDNRSIILASDVYGGLKKKGFLVEDPDLLIACMCISSELPVVTGDAKHFERFKEFGLEVRALGEFLRGAR